MTSLDQDPLKDRPFEIGQEDNLHIPRKLKDQKLQEENKNWNNPGFSGAFEESEVLIAKKSDQLRENFYGLGPKGYVRSDEKIYEEACDELMKNKDVDASEIMVYVKNGIVHLMGKVQSRYMKKIAEVVVEHLAGVKDVRNDLVILRHQKILKGSDSVLGKDLGIT